jgi:hypothetical protein
MVQEVKMATRKKGIVWQYTGNASAFERADVEFRKSAYELLSGQAKPSTESNAVQGRLLMAILDFSFGDEDAEEPSLSDLPAEIALEYKHLVEEQMKLIRRFRKEPLPQSMQPMLRHGLRDLAQLTIRNRIADPDHTIQLLELVTGHRLSRAKKSARKRTSASSRPRRSKP